MKDSKYIDHTLLKAFSTEEEILKICAEAVKYDFKSVCVNPTWITTAKKALADSGVLVCTVIGFPLGANTVEVKAFETAKAIEDGADEVKFSGKTLETEFKPFEIKTFRVNF